MQTTKCYIDKSDAVALQSMFKTCRPSHLPVFSAFAEALSVPPPLDMDEWSDEFRVIPDGESSEPGLWRTSRFPYHREIMKCLSRSSRCKYIDVRKGSQLGFTELAINWMLYTADYDPAPMLYVQNTEVDVNDFSSQKLMPSIRACKQVAAKFAHSKSEGSASKTLLKTFPGGFIALGGANAAHTLRSRSIGRLGLDEIDSYKLDVNNEGDPILLAERRTTNFPDAKIYRLSTPTILETSRITQLCDLGDQRHYYVPCPHCNASADREGTYFTIEWKNIKWDNNNPNTVRLVCPHCAADIQEHHKTWMLAHGKWIAHNPSRPDQQPGDVDVEHASFIISALYSPLGFFSWKQAVAMWLQYTQSKDKTILKVFINTVLGEGYSETGKNISHEALLSRCEYYSADNSFQVPKGVRIITAGVDIQDNRIEYEILGHGRNNETWSIEYNVLYGDPEQSQVWRELDVCLQKQYRHESGQLMNIACTAIDTGHCSKQVYSFCKTREFRKVFAIKGRQGWGNGYLRRPTKPHKDYGVYLFILWVDELKSNIYSQLSVPSPGPQFCHFPKLPVYDAHYFQMLTAETLKSKKEKGQTVIYWDCPEGKRNEALDCRGYAIGALHILGVDVNKLADLDIVLTNTQHQVQRKVQRKVWSKGLE